MHIEIISELHENGDLLTFQATYPDICKKESFKRQMASNITEGLLWLHDNDIIHCNLKPYNILIDKNSEARISDFGFFKTVTS